MAALLVACMHLVDDFSSDILAAAHRWADMKGSVRQRQRDGDLKRWNRYLEGLRRDSQPMPGCTHCGATCVAHHYLAATLDMGLNTMRNHRPSDLEVRGRRAARCRDHRPHQRRTLGACHRLLRS